MREHSYPVLILYCCEELLYVYGLCKPSYALVGILLLVTTCLRSLGAVK